MIGRDERRPARTGQELEGRDALEEAERLVQQHCNDAQRGQNGNAAERGEDVANTALSPLPCTGQWLSKPALARAHSGRYRRRGRGAWLRPGTCGQTVRRSLRLTALRGFRSFQGSPG